MLRRFIPRNDTLLNAFVIVNGEVFLLILNFAICNLHFAMIFILLLPLQDRPESPMDFA